jgi:four helix bundle protein
MSLHYTKLVVWQRADDLFIEMHRLTHQVFPRIERFELGSQLRRAAYSVPANVVEGSARQGDADKIKFFNIASSSLSEVTYGIHAALRLGYIDQDTHDRLDDMCRMVAGPLHGLIRHHRAKQNATVVGQLGHVSQHQNAREL